MCGPSGVHVRRAIGGGALILRADVEEHRRPSAAVSGRQGTDRVDREGQASAGRGAESGGEPGHDQPHTRHTRFPAGDSPVCRRRRVDGEQAVQVRPVSVVGRQRSAGVTVVSPAKSGSCGASPDSPGPRHCASSSVVAPHTRHTAHTRPPYTSSPAVRPACDTTLTPLRRPSHPFGHARPLGATVRMPADSVGTTVRPCEARFGNGQRHERDPPARRLGGRRAASRWSRPSRRARGRPG